MANESIFTLNPSGALSWQVDPTDSRRTGATQLLNRIAANPDIVNLMNKKLEKDEGKGLTTTQNAANALTSRYARMMHPDEYAKGMYAIQEFPTQGLRKQRDLANAIEGGLGGILQSYKDSPVSAMRMKGIASGVDQLFGTNTKDILTDTTHNIAMQIPKLAELAEKSRGKVTQAESILLNKLLSDFDTTKSSSSAQDTFNFKKGLLAQAANSGKPLTEYQKRRRASDISEKAAEFTSKYLSADVKLPLKTISDIYKKYPVGKAPAYKTNIGLKFDAAKNMTRDTLQKYVGVGGRDKKELERDLDAAMLSSAYDVIAQFAAKAVDSRITDKDVVLAAQNFNRSWETGDEIAKRKALNNFIKKLEDKRMTFYDLLLPDEKQYLDANNKGHKKYWKSIGSVPSITGRGTNTLKPIAPSTNDDDDDGFGKMGE